MRSKVKFFIPQVIKAVSGDVEAGLNRAGAFIVRTAKIAVNRPHGSRYIVPETRGNKGIKRNKTAGMIIGLDPSKPGEPPKKLTASLQNSIAWEIARHGLTSLKLRIGVTSGAAAKYARRLEFGFRGSDSEGRSINQAPRPFIRPILVKDKIDIIKALVKR